MVQNDDGAIVGVVAICIESGETVYIEAKATVLATGGAGRIYQSTTNALINTGDGVGMALRMGFAPARYGNVAVPPDGHRWSRHFGHRGFVAEKVVT